MREVFITKVYQSATDEGNVLQKVEMVFKALCIQYYQQGVDPKFPGALTSVNEFFWDIPAGKSDSGGLPDATYKP
jgi:hypothetical protein